MILVLAIVAIAFRLLFGIFVIQPIGAVPEGATIIYWRTNLNLPFIASVDGLLSESENGVSLIGRGVLLSALAKPILENEIMRFGYSEWLYLESTNGKMYNN